ncbi:hypothetical protein [Serratia marcescens]|uniref:hypothetical protein n=1 Tax=Serratia marcescens TaxID=615 RepID=UPI0013279BD7|nr:hypothetical protein [Serratia marcescens]MXS94419.1 hypothetical protein [Serratia marcescens]QHJ25340.1 hypothetical protein GV243_05835 [Serratia marcescens]
MASKGIQKLVSDAEAAGCHVRRNGDRFEISKPGRKGITLVICADGTAYRGDCDLTVCNAIRTQAEMRNVLKIK